MISIRSLRTAAVDTSGTRAAVANNVTNLYFQKNTWPHRSQHPLPALASGCKHLCSSLAASEKYCPILSLNDFTALPQHWVELYLPPPQLTSQPGASDCRLIWKQGVLSWVLMLVSLVQREDATPEEEKRCVETGVRRESLFRGAFRIVSSYQHLGETGDRSSLWASKMTSDFQSSQLRD